MRNVVLLLLCTVLGLVFAITVKTGVDYIQYNAYAALGIPFVATTR